MSTTFSPGRYDAERERYVPLYDCRCAELDEFCSGCIENTVNVGYSYDMELLRWLWITPEPCGHIKATELAAKCRRRLWDEPRNHDPAIEGSDTGGPGTGQCRSIYFGRREGYLRMRTEELLKIAELAGDHYVFWG